MAITEIATPAQGIIGYLHEVDCKDNESVLLFQLPRPTNMLSDTYIRGAMDTITKSLPPGRNAMVIGADVNVYELLGADAVLLRLKGII